MLSLTNHTPQTHSPTAERFLGKTCSGLGFSGMIVLITTENEYDQTTNTQNPFSRNYITQRLPLPAKYQTYMRSAATIDRPRSESFKPKSVLYRVVRKSSSPSRRTRQLINCTKATQRRCKQS